jgi:DNA adenine methylase
MKTKIQPLFKWTGSKQRMLQQYAPHFFHSSEFTRFVDLFAGGLTNSLWVYEKFPQKEYVVNDWNGELTLLYSTLANNSDEVIKEWFRCVEKWLSLSEVEERKKYYYELRDVYCLAYEGESDVYLSSLLLFMLQVNFNGMWKAYKKCNERYSTPPGTCLQKQSFFDVNKIKNVASFLKKATITTGDFAIHEPKPGDWLYADPPYRDSIVLYQGGFTEDDQIRLADYLTSSKCNFAYSNKDIGDGFYERHFSGCSIIPMSAKYTAGRGTSTLDVTEVLVTNY